MCMYIPTPEPYVTFSCSCTPPSHLHRVSLPKRTIQENCNNMKLSSLLYSADNLCRRNHCSSNTNTLNQMTNINSGWRKTSCSLHPVLLSWHMLEILKKNITPWIRTCNTQLKFQLSSSSTYITDANTTSLILLVIK
jgi:hypothetical protein